MRHIHVSCFMVFPIQVHHRCIDPIDFIDISRCSGLYCKARHGFQAEEPAKKKLKNSQHTSTHQTCLSYGGLCYVQNAFASIFGEIPKFLQNFQAFSAASLRQRYLQLHGTEGTDHGDVVDAVDAPSVAATSVTTEQCLDADWKEQALNEEKVRELHNVHKICWDIRCTRDDSTGFCGILGVPDMEKMVIYGVNGWV